MGRALVTGTAGFLGSHLADRLLDDGHEVVGVDNLVTGRRSNLAHLANDPRFRLLVADVAEPFPIDGPLDWIFHFASPASPPKYLREPIGTLRVNAEGTRHLLELAERSGAKFLLASTSEVYGDPLVHPQPESYWGHVNPIGPRSVYDEAKRYAEALTMAFHRERGVDTRIVRIFNTYGPRMDPRDGRVVTNMVAQALSGRPLTIYGDGTQTRSFCYVSDLVDGIMLLAAKGDAQPLNLGNPHEVTMLELAEIVQRVAGTRLPLLHAPLPEDDPRLRRPDIARAKALLGWEPRVALGDGLRETLEAIRAERPEAPR